MDLASDAGDAFLKGLLRARLPRLYGETLCLSRSAGVGAASAGAFTALSGVRFPGVAALGASLSGLAFAALSGVGFPGVAAVGASLSGLGAFADLSGARFPGVGALGASLSGLGAFAALSGVRFPGLVACVASRSSVGAVASFVGVGVLLLRCLLDLLLPGVRLLPRRLLLGEPCWEDPATENTELSAASGIAGLRGSSLHIFCRGTGVFFSTLHGGSLASDFSAGPC